MFWDRSSGPFPAFFISIYNLFNKSPNMAPKQPSCHGYRFWVSINSINSVPSFGTDQTAVQGLKLTETSKSTKNGNKTQVGRESYLKEFEETPDPRVHALSSPRRTASLLDSKRSNGRIARDLREKSETLSLKPPFPFPAQPLHLSLSKSRFSL